MSRVPRGGCKVWPAVLAGVAAALSVVACGEESEGAAEGEVRIVDNTNSVTDSNLELGFAGDIEVTTEPDPLTADVLGLAEPGHDWDLRLVWPGGSCHTEPMAEFDGDGETITAITVDVGPWNEPDGSMSCDAAKHRHVLDLTTTATVADDLELTLLDDTEDS